MVGKYVRAAVAGAVAAVAVAAVAGGGASVAQEKKLTIGEIMKAGHDGAESFTGVVNLSSKAGKWDAAVKAAKSLNENAALMGKATPKRGEAESWTKLTANYHKNTSALLAAAEKKDLDATQAAVGTLIGSCKECHMAHKGGKKK